MDELVRMCEEKEMDVVLVYKVDRLSRRQKHIWYLLEDVFEPNQVGFTSITEPFDTTSATGRAFLGMLGVFAQLERDTIAERTVDALNHKRGKREWMGRPPYGFRVVEKKLVVVPEEIETIKRIKRLHRKKKSLRDIGKRVGLSHTKIRKILDVDIRVLKNRYLS